MGLAPVDPDGDSVRCRWAASTEAQGAYTNPSYWPSLSLDTANCIVKYDGTKDSSGTGVKPIGIMMEDVASNGSVRSAIPVQFLAQVWTPNMNARSARYPDWFGGHEESAAHPHLIAVPPPSTLPQHQLMVTRSQPAAQFRSPLLPPQRMVPSRSSHTKHHPVCRAAQ